MFRWGRRIPTAAFSLSMRVSRQLIVTPGCLLSALAMMAAWHAGSGMLNAQQLPPIAVSGHAAAQPSAYQPPVQRASRRRSTGFERFGWGLVTGMVQALIADQAAGEMDRGPGLAIYAVGAVLGVGLVTGAREGLRPPRLLAGWAAGVGVGVVAALLACEADQDAAGGCQLSGQAVGALLFVVAVPLGASVGHGTGR